MTGVPLRIPFRMASATCPVGTGLIVPDTAFNSAGSCGPSPANWGVSTSDRKTQDTATPCGRSSLRMMPHNPLTAYLVGPYAEYPDTPSNPAADEIQTMLPLLLSIIEEPKRLGGGGVPYPSRSGNSGYGHLAICCLPRRVRWGPSASRIHRTVQPVILENGGASGDRCGL